MTESGTKSTSPWLAMVVLCVGQSVVLIDTTIVNTAIPNVMEGLGASLSQVLWTINAYTMPYALLLVTAGRLGDLYGPKRLFQLGLAIFTVASAACGMAQNPTQLIAARVLQGIGGALLTPQSLTILMRIFPAERRGTALGIWGSVAGLAGAVGPTVGGLLVGPLGWRWVFFVNVPVGVIALVTAGFVLPKLAGVREHKLDVLGTALLTAGLFPVVYGLIEGPSHAWGAIWGPVTVPMLIAFGVVALLVFVIVERRRQDREPLLPFTILRDRNFTLMGFVVAALPCSLGAMLLLTMIFLQSAVRLSPLEAGLTVAVAPLVSVFFAPTSGRLTDRFGGKYVNIVGLVLFAGGIAYLATVAQADATSFDLVPGLLLVGVAMGVVFAPAAVLAMRDIEPALSGAASGVFSLMRLSGSLIGSAMVGAVLQARLAESLRQAAEVQAASLPADLHDRFVATMSGTAIGSLENGAAAGAINTAGLPEAVAEGWRQATDTALREGLSQAVASTYWIPVVILLLGALATVAVRQGPVGLVPAHSVAESRRSIRSHRAGEPMVWSDRLAGRHRMVLVTGNEVLVMRPARDADQVAVGELEDPARSERAEPRELRPLAGAVDGGR